MVLVLISKGSRTHFFQFKGIEFKIIQNENYAFSSETMITKYAVRPKFVDRLKNLGLVISYQ